MRDMQLFNKFDRKTHDYSQLFANNSKYCFGCSTLTYRLYHQHEKVVN